MEQAFERKKNSKAFAYTAVILALILLIAFAIKLNSAQPPKPVILEYVEVNLGNLDEGEGTVQPLIKGEKAPDGESNPEPIPAANQPEPQNTDEQPLQTNDADDGAVIKKPTETPKPQPKNILPKPNTAPVKPSLPNTAATKPVTQKPKIAGYGGPTTGKGNGATEDNGYRMQGKKPGGKGDAGNPNGNPDSYGKDAGGKIGVPTVTKGNRRIVSAGAYNFTDDLDKATIYALIKVDAAGNGSFIGFDKGSTSRNQAYASAIKRYLPKIGFNKAAEEGFVTVVFNFNVN
jgi:outer membrane biosynthesis protein TonB